MTPPDRGGSPGPVAPPGPGGSARPRPLRIGITGPIGCGKSTVAGWLGELGASVIDADQVAREVTPPGSDSLASVVDTFGSSVLRADGTLDRGALGRIVFADPAALARLEAIIHPATRLRILELIGAAEAAQAEPQTAAGADTGADARADAGGTPGSQSDLPSAIVVEAIKLVEGGLAALCDEVWLVTCDPAEQRERLATRGAAPGRASDPASHADIEARIAAQAGLVARLTPYATRIIDTTGTIGESRSRVVAVWMAAVGGAKASEQDQP